MKCECGSTRVDLVGEREIQRWEGNNYDIVKWEAEWQCQSCMKFFCHQEMAREAAGTEEYMTDGQNSTESPARFGT